MRFLKLGTPRPPADVEDAATYWLTREQLGLLTSRERAALDAWRSDPACEAAYRSTAATLDALATIAADAQVLRMRETALAQLPPPAPQHRGRYVAAAAVALIAVIIGMQPRERSHVETSDTVIADAQHTTLAPQRYTTKVGERSTITLDDGSVIALNTASVLEVAYSTERRDVRLLQGQALFHVAKNPERPFVVAAGDRRVTALGTAFDVRLDANAVKVVLVEGRVTVEPMKLSGLERLVPALARLELAPGEQLTAAVNQPVSVAIADVDRDTSWRRGEIILRDDTLVDAIAEMNRYTQTQILIGDPKLSGLRVSGVFGVTRPENFIAALLAYYPIEAQHPSAGVTVLTWRSPESKISR